MRSRHLPRLVLAPVALAAAAVVGFGPAASADAATCGQPAVPAVYQVIDHPAVVAEVPAVTHQEWRWERSQPTTDAEYSKVVAAAQGTWSWSRPVEVLEHQVTWTVIDRAAVPGQPEVGHFDTRVLVPAQVETLWEYVQQQTGNTRWEREGWNAGAGGRGWSPTGNTDEQVVVPAVTEQVWVVDVAAVPPVAELSHQEFAWVADGDAAPVGSAPTGSTRTVVTGEDTVSIPEGEQPVGAGWIRGAWTESAAAVIDVIWLPQGTTPPDGYDATGATRAGAPLLEEAAGTSATAPAGSGWAQVTDSAVTIVDAAAFDRVDAEAWSEEVLVSPEIPATDACPVVDDGEVDGEDDEDGDSGGEIGGPVDDDGTDGVVAGESAGQHPETVPAVAVTTVSHDALPDTGNGTEPWLLGLGLASVLAGACLVAPRPERARDRV